MPQPASGTQAGTLSYGAGEQVARNRRRQSAAVAREARNVPRAMPRSASTRCGRTAASPGRDYTRAREQVDRPVDRVRPQHADTRHPVGPDHAPGQPRRLRAARRPRPRSVRSTPTSIVAATPVDQANYYGSPDYDYDHGEPGQRHCSRLEHDFAPSVTLRNQTRYNTTTREAVITSIANAAAYNPATNLVTLSRRRTSAHNDIFSNQTNLSARDDDRPAAPRAQRRASRSRAKSQFAPTLGGVGTRAPIDLNQPDVFSPVIGMNDRADRGVVRWQHRHGRALRLRRVRSRAARCASTAAFASRRYDTKSHAVTAAGVVTDIDGDGTLVSGKAGIVFRLNSSGQCLRVVRLVAHAARIGKLSAERGADATRTIPTSIRRSRPTTRSARKWDLAGGRLQLTGASFWTEEQERHLRRRCHGGPADLQSGRRAEGEGRDRSGVVGQITPRLGHQHEPCSTWIRRWRARTRRPTESDWR